SIELAITKPPSVSAHREAVAAIVFEVVLSMPNSILTSVSKAVAITVVPSYSLNVILVKVISIIPVSIIPVSIIPVLTIPVLTIPVLTISSAVIAVLSLRDRATRRYQRY